MKPFTLGSISNRLFLLILVAVLPALLILLYTGMEQRQRSIEKARQDVLLLTHTMAEIQRNVTDNTRRMLATLSLLPAIQRLDKQACRALFENVLEQNTTYLNITLTAPDGKVLAAGQSLGVANLKDRKHFREAINNKKFSFGEYIISRVGTTSPAFAFAYPVLDKTKQLKAVLTTTIRLSDFSRFQNLSKLPEKSFVAVTDHQGIRLFYYPAKKQTNPVGKPIKTSSWEKARKAQQPGFFMGKGSDGTRRLFAFEQVRLTDGEAPYLYVWAGIPESHILGPANATLIRNLLIMLFVTAMSLFTAWLIGKKTFLSPMQHLLTMTQNFAAGKLEIHRHHPQGSDEFDLLTKAFYDMAETLEKNQRTLRENEARFRLLMDSLDALVYVADMDTYEILFINEYGKNMFGDVTGETCWQHLQKGQDGPCSFCTNKHLLKADGTPKDMYNWECQHSKTGQYFYIQNRAIQWVDGRIVRLEVATDITKRKLAETRLAEESERLDVTLRSIGDGVITTDTRGRIMLINKVAENLTGWARKDAINRPLEQVFHIVDGETRQPCESPVEKVLASGKIFGLAEHTVLLSKGGEKRVIADSGAPIRDKYGNIIGVVLVFRDITEQLRTEGELLKVKKLQSIGVLAGGIAHDFNNILAAVLGNINLALFDPDLKDETRELLSAAEKASLRAKNLTQQLLTFAKGGEPVKETSSLEHVIKDSADFILHGDTIACGYDIPADLWLVDIDKGQVSQVIQNIVLNAGHAMPGGGIIKIRCENFTSVDDDGYPAVKKGRFVKICIKDNGIGMTADVVENIFDPYFSTKHEGSGLGLAITQSIIARHNGHISVESSPGSGTTFTIYLPASKKTETQLQKLSAEKKMPSGAKTLIMDDEEMVRAITGEMLSQLGHEVTVSANGSEAIKKYQEAIETGNPFDLVIMDLTIPGGMGGKEAVQELLKIEPLATVIVSSGYSNDPVMANYKDYGFSAAIVKPYQLQELSRVVATLLA